MTEQSTGTPATANPDENGQAVEVRAEGAATYTPPQGPMMEPPPPPPPPPPGTPVDDEDLRKPAELMRALVTKNMKGRQLRGPYMLMGRIPVYWYDYTTVGEGSRISNILAEEGSGAASVEAAMLRFRLSNGNLMFAESDRPFLNNIEYTHLVGAINETGGLVPWSKSDEEEAASDPGEATSQQSQ